MTDEQAPVRSQSCGCADCACQPCRCDGPAARCGCADKAAPACDGREG